MYKVLGIRESASTRFVTMLNLTTKTIDECFDDSALVSIENFEFMQVDECYDCKIILFGNVVSCDDENGVICNIINRNVTIGSEKFFEVLVGLDKYYISSHVLDKCVKDDFLRFAFTRKDLLKVNDIVHADFI